MSSRARTRLVPEMLRLSCDVGALPADGIALDALARLQLAARRAGLELEIWNASDELCCPIEITGLQEVLRVEPERQAEQREERLAVEEERELDDPAACELDHLQRPRVVAVARLVRLVLSERARAVGR